MDKLTSLRVFCRVIETASFAQAGRELKISPAMISKHVARLEQDLNTRLLNRTTRRVSATEAGRSYYQRTQQILAALDEAEEEISTLSGRPSGSLKVSMPLDFGLSHLAPAVADFLVEFPEMSLEVQYDDRRVDMVSEGFDVVVRIGVMEDSSLIARKLAEDRDVICASPEYLRRHGTPSHPSELRHHAHLSYHYWPENDNYTFDGPDGPVTVHWGSRLRANNGSSLCTAAIRGLGVIAQPTFIVAEALRRGDLVHILPEYSVGPIGIYAVYPHRRLLSTKVRSFVDFLARRFADADYFSRDSQAGAAISGVGSPTP